MLLVQGQRAVERPLGGFTFVEVRLVCAPHHLLGFLSHGFLTASGPEVGGNAAAAPAALRAGPLPASPRPLTLYIEQQPFAEDHVRKMAEALSQKPWEDVRIAMPPGWDS